jgi:hypothetical protein
VAAARLYVLVDILADLDLGDAALTDLLSQARRKANQIHERIVH